MVYRTLISVLNKQKHGECRNVPNDVGARCPANNVYIKGDCLLFSFNDTLSSFGFTPRNSNTHRQGPAFGSMSVMDTAGQ